MHYPPLETASFQDAFLHPCWYSGFAPPLCLLGSVSLAEAGMVGYVVVVEDRRVSQSHDQWAVGMMRSSPTVSVGMEDSVRCSSQTQSLRTAVDGGSKVGGQAVGDADILVDFEVCHYMQVKMLQRDCLPVALGTHLLLHAAGEECFFVGERTGSAVVCNCCMYVVVQVHIGMVGGQQLEKNDAFGLRLSAYLGVFVCKVILGHVAE